MTNTIAIRLGLLLALAFLIDAVFLQGDSFLFLARKTFLLIDWIAFWR